MWQVKAPARDGALQLLLDAAEAAIGAGAKAPEPRPAARRVFSALRRRAAPASARLPQGLPVCEALDEALAIAAQGPRPVARVAEAFSAVAPRLCWTRRSGADPALSAFYNGHANAEIVGNGGLEERGDVRIGVTLMAPNVTYVEHDHPPEEVYLALTPGEWWNSAMDWTDPGIGGLIYNPPGIRHAMRSGATPMLALWFLPVE